MFKKRKLQLDKSLFTHRVSAAFIQISSKLCETRCETSSLLHVLFFALVVRT